MHYNTITLSNKANLLLIIREREMSLVIQRSHLGQESREGGEVS